MEGRSGEEIRRLLGAAGVVGAVFLAKLADILRMTTWMV